MSDNGEPPAKRSKYNLRSYTKCRNEEQMLEKISLTKFLDLNDDCINEVFRHLNVIQLCSVTQVCKRLQELAQSYFKRKYSEFDFSSLFQDRLVSNQEASDILRNFGPIIKTVTLPRQAFHNHQVIGRVEEVLLKDVVEYCGKTLLILKLKSFYLTSPAVETLNLFSGSLKKLYLDGNAFAEDCVLHLITFSKLKSLTLIDASDSYALMDTFPALESLRLYKVFIPNQSILQHFIARHKQLKKLIINSSRGVSSEIIRYVSKYVRNIRTFEFYNNSIIPSESNEEIQKNILHLSEFKNLQEFRWKSKSFSIGNVLSKMVSNKIAIKVLQIADGLNDDQTIEAITQMKDLENLKFYRMDGLNQEHLITYAKKLTQLKKLSIYLQQNITDVGLKEILRHAKQMVDLRVMLKDFLLDSGLYNYILGIVKDRRNGTNLKLTIYSAEKQVLVPQETIHANGNWLVINQQRSW